jgi:hypothetical protein
MGRISSGILKGLDKAGRPVSGLVNHGVRSAKKMWHTVRRLPRGKSKNGRR